VRRLAIALLVLAPIAVAAGWIVYFSPWLAVNRIDITVQAAPDAAGPLGPDDVHAVAEVETGTPLIRVPVDDIEARLAALPQVESATVTRSWPDALVIDVVRRQPVAVVASAAGYDVVDATGAVIRTASTVDDGVPVVRASGEGVGAAVTVASDLPAEIGSRVVGLEATSRNDVTLLLGDGSEVMWGSADEGAFKAEVLAALLRVGAKYYDVSSPGVPATSDTPRR
jgi:cell division protein FtsQ